MRDYFSDEVEIEVVGLNFERLLKRLKSEQIDLLSVRRPKRNRLVLRCRSKWQRQVVAILKESCYNEIYIQKCGRGRVSPFFRKRPGILVGCALFLLVVIACSNLLFGVEIACENEFSRAEIENAVSELDVKFPCLAKRVSTDALEREILKRSPSVSFVSVRRFGMRLKISVVSANVALPPEDDSAVRDLVADRDGVITRLIVMQGTPLVSVGDQVKKGQILIGGYLEAPDGERFPVRAVGEVYAKVLLTEREERPISRVVFLRTGKTHVARKLTFCGLESEVGAQDVPFAFFEQTTKTEFAFPNSILSIVLVTKTSFELQPVEMTLSSEDIQSIKSVLRLRAFSKLFENISVIEEEFMQEKTDRYLFTYRLHAECRIETTEENT